MSRIEKVYAFALKAEGAPLTDAVPTMAADAIRLAEPMIPKREYLTPNTADGEQTGGKGTFPSSERGGTIHQFSGKRRLRGIGVAYGDPGPLPEEDVLMMMILGNRNIVTTVGSEEVQYSGVDEGEVTATALGQTIKQEWKGLGTVPRSASIEWNAAGHMFLNFELVSVGQPLVQKVLDAATLDAVIAPIFKGGLFTLNGVALKPISGSMDFGLTLSEPQLDGTAADGFGGWVITDRAPTGTMTVRKEDLATFDPYALADASTPVPWVFQSSAAANSYNNIKIEADRLEIQSVNEVSRGGLVAWELPFIIHRAVAPSLKDPLISWIR